MSFSSNKKISSARIQKRRLIAAFGILLALLALSGAAIIDSNRTVEAQTITTSTAGLFRLGEKLTYDLSFGKIQDAGYVETHVVSRGKLAGKDAVEVRARVKTVDIVSAAFFQFDTSRIVFATPDTGLPLYLTSSSQDSVVPKDVVRNFLSQPTSSFDLLTLIFKARDAGGVGSFPLFEDEQLHTVTFLGSSQEKVKTAAGDFETTVSTVQSEFLTANGIKDLRINFSNDEFRLPVLVRIKTLKGEFRALLSAVVLPEPTVPLASPTPTPTPKATPATKPSPTPSRYVDNQPLIPDLGFDIGETLDYRFSVNGKPVGVLTLNARERKLVESVDTLRLTATVTGVEQGIDVLKLGESSHVLVDPDTLAPSRLEAKFTSQFLGLKQTVTFDRKTGSINFGEKASVEAPIGTHSFLSLIYAMRSFNLKPSRNASNPVNDTRVAVFWETRSHVFTLRPAMPQDLEVNGEKVSAQMIVINTGVKELDAFGLKIWLRTADRVPVRLSAGPYQADLISNTTNLF